jgi:hypothetical protein
MATLNATLRALERHVGLPQSRSRTVARRLQEAHILPLGGPGIAPELTADAVVSLVIALASDTPLHGAVEAVQTYRDLTPVGAPLDALPDTIRYTAGDFLDGLADEPANARNLKIEIVSTWPEIALHYSDGTIRRIVAPGADASAWQARGHRRSITINGAAFADAINELFGGNE